MTQCIITDSHELFKELEAAGLDDQQAEAQIRVVKQVVGSAVETAMENIQAKEHVTKTEMLELKTELKTDMHELKTELKTEMHEIRTDLHTMFSKLSLEIKDVRVEIERSKNSTLLWVFTMVLGALLINSGTLSKFLH